jgi:hypothetical protein
MAHHHTDTLGTALDDVARSAATLAEDLAAAVRHLADERQAHRHETRRLVERAERAETALAEALREFEREEATRGRCAPDSPRGMYQAHMRALLAGA